MALTRRAIYIKRSYIDDVVMVDRKVPKMWCLNCIGV